MNSSLDVVVENVRCHFFEEESTHDTDTGTIRVHRGPPIRPHRKDRLAVQAARLRLPQLRNLRRGPPPLQPSAAPPATAPPPPPPLGGVGWVAPPQTGGRSQR